MNVILLQKVRNLGVLGEQVAVKPGYARNFLIPKGKAIFANEANVLKFESRKAELLKAEADELSAAQQRGQSLAGLSVTILSNAGDEGKLFGSIGTREIAEAISERGFPVEKHEVRLPEGPIRHVGEYEIALHLHGDVVQAITVVVAAG